jgi:hypothetical protein
MLPLKANALPRICDRPTLAVGISTFAHDNLVKAIAQT